MSVRSLIGHEHADGSIRYLYCHGGGEPRTNGRLLVRHYGDAASVTSLLDLGPLSSLGRRVAPRPNQAHTYDTPARGVTVAYHRDRGEDRVEASTTTDRSDLLTEEKAYLFVENEGRWWMHHCEGGDWEAMDQGAPRDVGGGEGSALASLRANLERLTRTSLKDPREEVIEITVPPEGLVALGQALEEVGLPGEPVEGEARFQLAAGETVDESEVRQLQAILAAARVASGGHRVIVRGPRRPRELQILGDQVVEPDTDRLDYSGHTRLLRKLERHLPDVAHPLAPRGVARARDKERNVPAAVASDDGSIFTLGEVRFGPRRDAVEVDVTLTFTGRDRGLVRVDHLARDGAGRALGFDRVESVVDGSSRFRSRLSTRVHLPAGSETATSDLQIVRYAPIVTVTAPDAPRQDGIAGTRVASEQDGLVLTEWALASQGGDRATNLEGVVCFTPEQTGVFAVRVARRSRGTVVDEEWVLTGRCGAGEPSAVSMRLRCRELDDGDVFFATVARLEVSETQSLTVTHGS